MEAKAILFTGVNEVGIGSVTIPTPGPGEVLIASSFTCVSPGTELRCLAGQQSGSPAWPYIPGYALAGTVVECGPDTTIGVGARVVGTGTQRADLARQWGGHISHAVCNEAQVYAVPDGVDLLDAVVTKLAAIAYHGVRVARPALHEKIAVIGLGPIGQVSLRLHALTGAHAVGCDRIAERVALARTAGLDALLVEDGLDSVFKSAFPDGADVVVDATGAQSIIPAAIGVARDLAWDDAPTSGPRYVIQGSYPDSFELPYQAAFLKELTFLMPRDCQPRDFRAVLDLLGRGKLILRDLISDVRRPDEAPQAYQQLQSKDPSLMTVAFQWD